MIDVTTQQRRDEDFKVKLGLILGSHFDKVEVDTHCIKVHHLDTVTIVDAKERKVLKSGNKSVEDLVTLVLANMDDAEAPLGINMIL